jgi:hypothetical protein
MPRSAFISQLFGLSKLVLAKSGLVCYNALIRTYVLD